MENDSSIFGNTHKGRQRCCAGQRFSCSARSVKESRGSWFTAGSGGTELLPQASVAAPPQPGPREGQGAGAQRPAPSAISPRMRRGPVRGQQPPPARPALHAVCRHYCRVWGRCLTSRECTVKRHWMGDTEGSGSPVISSFCVAASQSEMLDQDLAPQHHRDW